VQEATITFLDNGTPGKTGTGKEFVKFKASDGREFTCWSNTEALKIAANQPATIKFSVKEVGQYTNYTIHAVKDADGNWPDTGSGGKAMGGARVAKADPDKMKQDKELEIARNKSIQRQVAAKEATVIALGQVAGGDTTKAFYEFWDEAYDHILTKLLEVK
jgi:hypothetical protein